MSATREAPRRERDPAEDETCAHCGSPLAADQEWCLQCGAARTLVHSPPSPGIALAIVAAVVLAALVALAIVLINLSTGANRELAATSPAAPTTAASASTSATSAAAVSSAATATTSAAATTAVTSTQTSAVSHSGGTIALASWPVGLSGWTVVLGRSASQASADALAEQLAANGLSVGVLDSSQHPRLPPGLFIVFSGRYPTQPEAAAAAAALRSRGQPQALARQVAPPGGI